MDGFEVSISYIDIYYCKRKGVGLSNSTMELKLLNPLKFNTQEERTKLREGVPYVKLYRYNSKHLYPKLNGYEDNGHRKV